MQKSASHFLLNEMKIWIQKLRVLLLRACFPRTLSRECPENMERNFQKLFRHEPRSFWTCSGNVTFQNIFRRSSSGADALKSKTPEKKQIERWLRMQYSNQKICGNVERNFQKVFGHDPRSFWTCSGNVKFRNNFRGPSWGADALKSKTPVGSKPMTMEVRFGSF